MINIQQIRDELKEVRYFYGHRKGIEVGLKQGVNNNIVNLVNKYNDAVRTAPAQLYDLYVGLYLEDNTQASLAEKWGYSNEHIRRLHNKLCAFLQGILI